MNANRTKAKLLVAALLSIGLAAFAATRTTANYTIITDSSDSCGAVFSPSVAVSLTATPVLSLPGAVVGYQLRIASEGMPIELITSFNPDPY